MKILQPSVLIFELLFLAMALAFLGGSLTPAFRGGNLPVIVAAITSGLMIASIAARIIGNYRAAIQRGSQKDVGEATAKEKPEGMVSPWHGFLIAVVYLGAFFGLVFLFGAYVGIPLFLLIFLVLHGTLSWPITLALFAVIGVGLPMVFRLAFNLNLWLGAVPMTIRGWIGGEFIPPI